MAAPVEPTESSTPPAPRDFHIPGVRAQSAEDAGPYFDTLQRLRGVDVAQLSEIDVQSYNDARDVYVDGCADLHANPAKQKTLENRANLSVAWAEAQARAGRQVWGVEVPDSVFESVPVVLAPAPRAREGSGRRRRGDATSRTGDSGDREPPPDEVARPRASRRARGGAR
jgi:hypothetical protein